MRRKDPAIRQHDCQGITDLEDLRLGENLGLGPCVEELYDLWLDSILQSHERTRHHSCQVLQFQNYVSTPV